MIGRRSQINWKLFIRRLSKRGTLIDYKHRGRLAGEAEILAASIRIFAAQEWRTVIDADTWRHSSANNYDRAGLCFYAL